MKRIEGPRQDDDIVEVSAERVEVLPPGGECVGMGDYMPGNFVVPQLPPIDQPFFGGTVCFTMTKPVSPVKFAVDQDVHIAAGPNRHLLPEK